MNAKPGLPDILIVTGTCGVGKSTISWEWSERRLGATIDCDTFRTWIRNPALITSDGFQEMLLARQSVHLARDYMALGMDVAINNVWTPTGLAYLREHLAGEARLRMIWLICTPKENRARDQQRCPSEVMGGRVDELQAELDALDWPDGVIRLDTTGQTVDETIAAIEDLFGQEPGMRLNGLTLRPSAPEDIDFICDVTRATMERYVIQSWGGTEAERGRAYRDDVVIGQDQIILLHGRQIGVLSLEHHEDRVFLDKLYILPDYQRWGIGTYLVRRVLRDAFARGLPVELGVLKVNPARQLYERLGFRKVDETDVSYVMQATP
ncbi:MAG: GNAT family N-acetyltransferase [Anaerolineae bacterium]|nr:GNAT family N-acetyltransferase [Anaerolineae bacterium]